MIQACGERGCDVLTMGEFCVEHDPPVLKTFARGRPYPPLKRSTPRERIRAAA